MILLCLDHMTSKHLRVLDLDLRIVEYVVIVIDVLNYFDRLLLCLFLGL